MANIEKFGSLNGQSVDRITLDSGAVQVSVLNFGAITQDWVVAGMDAARHVVLGFTSVEDYLTHSKSHGIIAGRVANRIAGGAFRLGDQDYRLPLNDGANHLHGGPEGLGALLWDMEPDGDAAVRLTHHSPDGAMGYPGAVDFEVIIRLHDTYCVTYEMRAVPDRATPINLAQHNYYNLNGSGDVRNHHAKFLADMHTPTGAGLIPDGRIISVDGTPLDFRQGRRFAQNDPKGQGVDNNLVLQEGRDPTQPCAVVRGDQSDLELTLWTDQPGLQIFNAPLMDVPVAGVNGAPSGPFAAFCLEPQYFPDAVNQPDFASTICSPDAHYFQSTTVKIASHT